GAIDVSSTASECDYSKLPASPPAIVADARQQSFGKLASVALPSEAERYLERLVVALEELRAGGWIDQSGGGELVASRLAHAGGALEAFLSVGLIDDDRMRTWWERVWLALG